MAKEFKAHKMYGKGGVVKFVKTIKEHLASGGGQDRNVKKE